MTVYAIAIIDDQGDCGAIYTPGAVFDDEGVWANDPTKRVVHITTQLSDNVLFAKNNFYSEDDVWLPRTERPGDYYNWVNSVWVVDADRLSEEIRQERDMLLFKSDWTQVADSPLTETQITSWATYRQDLRDVPSLNTGANHLDQVAWPTPPS